MLSIFPIIIIVAVVDAVTVVVGVAALAPAPLLGLSGAEGHAIRGFIEKPLEG